MTDLSELAVPRPVGTDENQRITARLAEIMESRGLVTQAPAFDCFVWERSESWITSEGSRILIHPSPFSLPFSGSVPVVFADSYEQLASLDFTGALLCLKGASAAEPLMPKDFPLYYPDEHKQLIELLERKNPAAVLACTEKHPMSGMSPYPLFEDGAFTLPSAYAEASSADSLGASAEVRIGSQRIPARSSQLIGTLKGTGCGKVIVCAHMDTKYDTPGALDNASGVLMMLHIMERLSREHLPVDVDFVPFNGEEYFAVSGQMTYLNHLGESVSQVNLVINIDGCGYRGSKHALSWYNMDNEIQQMLEQAAESSSVLTSGEQWYEGDHSMFAFQGIPCIAVTSSDLTESVLELTHTWNDTPDHADPMLIEAGAEELSDLILEVTRSF